MTELAAPTMPAVDLQVIDDLMEQVGDDDGEMLSELIGSYLVDGSEQIGRFGSAARTQDTTTVLSTAHTLRSTSGLLGAGPLVTLLKQAEDVARRNPADLPRMDALVETEFARVVQSLSDLRERRAGHGIPAGTDGSRS